MRYGSIGLAVAALLGAALPCLGDDKMPVGHAKFPKLDDERVTQFVAAMLAEGKYEPPVTMEAPIEPELKYVWAGNQVFAETRIEQVTLQLVNPESPQKEMNVMVKLGDWDYVVRHDRPRLKKVAGGMRIPLYRRLRNSFRYFLDGQDDTAIAVIGASPVQEAPSRGVMICPRDIPKTLKQEVKPGKRADLTLEASPWKVAKVRFDGITAKGNARTLTGVEPGLSAVRIFTSTNIPRSTAYEDKAYIKDPAVAASYSPFREEVLTDIEDPENIVGGIKVEITQHLSSGFKRVTRAFSTVSIKTVNFEQPYNVPVPGGRFYGSPLAKSLPYERVERIDRLEAAHRDNSWVTVDSLVGPGNCLLVMREDHPQSIEYLKEPLPANP